MRTLLLLTLGSCWAQIPGFQVPSVAGQGQVIRVTGGPLEGKWQVRFGGKVFPVFPNPDGVRLLIPVDVFQKPGDYELDFQRLDAAGGQKLPLEVRAYKFPTQNIAATKEMKSIEPLPGEMEAMRALAGTVSPVRHFEPAFIAPVGACQNSPFGVLRLHNGKPTGAFHRGADQRAGAGTPVKAIASGEVKISRKFRLNGWTVGIDHGQGLTTHYIHLSKLIAVEGQMVKQGDVVGLVGSTGFATGPHLHWGTIVHNTPVDPNQFVTLTPCAK